MDNWGTCFSNYHNDASCLKELVDGAHIVAFIAIVSQLKMHYFSGGAFESLISSQLLKKEKYIWSY